MKIARGGIISKNPFIPCDFGKECVIPLKDKYQKIYYRTKNRRIKKKVFKRSPMFQLQEQLKKYLILPGSIEPININIGGRILTNDNLENKGE